MAEKGFGVKEINLIGASGTPTIESPNNLNLNAVNVAISTNVSIGGTLSVTGNVSVGGTLTYEDVTNIDSVGIVTAREGIIIPDNKALSLGNRLVGSTAGDLRIYHDTNNSYIDEIGAGNLFIRNGSNNSIFCQTQGTVRLYNNGNEKLATTSTGVSITGTCVATTFSGSGASLTNLPAANLTGTLPAISGANLTNLPGGTPADTDPQVVFDVSASGSSGYIFTGPGNDGSTVNPNIFLIRGQRYRFINTTGSNHPFEFRNADNSADFTDGITGSQSGTQDFNVQYDAPAHLKYRCTIHGSMIGNIYIRSGADTGASAGTGNIEVDGFLRFDNTVSKIITDTSDGSDNKAILINGGGDTATSRGALAIFYGNELNSGRLDLYSGVGGGAITFNTGTTTTERLRITSGGFTKIGFINNINPTEPLNVVASAINQDIARFTGANQDRGLVISTAVSGSINDALIKYDADSQNSAGQHAFLTDGSERLRITSDGNISMGVVGHDPLTRLHVQDSNNGALKDVLTITNQTGSSGTEVGMVFECGTDEIARISAKNEGSDLGPLIFSTASSTNANPTEKLRITSDGSTQIRSGVLQRRYESTNTAGYRYYTKAERFLVPNGGSGLNFSITGMTQGWASIRFGGYTEGNRVNFRADIAGYNAGNSGVRIYDSNEITNQATAYAGGASCSITVTKNNTSYVVNVTQSNPQSSSMAGFYYFESGGYNSVSTLTVS